MQIAIIGRPNVGKSTLFNRIIGQRKALVHHLPGTTRDTNCSTFFWGAKSYSIVDTGGWGDETSEFSKEIEKQMNVALSSSQVAIFVVDSQTGIMPLDLGLLKTLRKKNIKTVLAVNKIDTEKDELKLFDFTKLGIKNMVGISSTHGLNIAELLDRACGLLDENSPNAPLEHNCIKIALVGKPNSGKSSLVNALCKNYRSIVSSTPGTTREAIDARLQRNNQDFILIDTPGLHKSRIYKNDLDYLSALSARKALESADVAVLLIDGDQGIGDTDTKIAELILESRCACLVAINKWDLIEEREEEAKKLLRDLEQKMKFISWTKIIYISAKTGLRTERILDEVSEIYTQYSKTVPQEELKEVSLQAESRKPYSRFGKVLRIQEVMQTGTKPPKFTYIFNDLEILHFSYKRYIENSLREHFGFVGSPISLDFRDNRVRNNRK
ncbi:MAG: ribosome biogenesis GTPase Der [Endomicrobiales bacterium]|nr:ribosome biogenesis GTPase Der [Endomicrobiales bacterium]